MCKISEHEKKLIEKLPTKYRISSSIGTLVNSRNDIFNRMSRNNQHISTDPQKAIAAKRHEAQTSKIHERITNEKAWRRPFASSQCFDRRNYKLNSGQRHLLRGEVSGPLHKVCLFCGAALVGARRVHILKTTEIARLAADQHPIYSRGIYYF